MRISNDEDLTNAVDDVSELLQEIQNYCKRENMPIAKIRFPRGFLRTCSQIRGNYNFIPQAHIRDNLAYTTLLSDTILWLLLRTDISGMARDMLIKNYIVLAGSIVECITKIFLKGKCGKNFMGRNHYLFEKAIIDKKLEDDLNWIWEMRSNIHLHDIATTEYANHYTRFAFVKCVSTVNRLISSLKRVDDNI